LANCNQAAAGVVVTGIGGFRGESSVRTWAYRIAVRHVLDRRKSRVEALALTFERFGQDLLDGLEAVRDPDPILAEEVKRGCTLAMLTCLDREHRLASVTSHWHLTSGAGSARSRRSRRAARLTGTRIQTRRDARRRG